MYADENDDLLCSAETGWKEMDPSNWVGDGPMIDGNPIGGTIQALKDGALWTFVDRMSDVYKCKTDKSGLERSFAISRMMNGAVGVDSEINPYRGSVNIPRPSEKAVFFDASSRRGWIDGSFWPFENISSGQPAWFIKDNRNITDRHANGYNIAFADTHCEYIKWKDRRTTTVAEWESRDLVNDSIGNRDITNLLILMKGY